MNVVLSYGLGVDSTALLLRWLNEPDSRNFELSDLLVVTSMTGGEWPRTRALVQEHILPRLRAAGVRFAQVARAGSKQADGIVVLDDTSSPTVLFADGAHKLEDELTSAGTVPQTGGKRICSMKFKGWVIDEYLRLHAPAATRHAFGFEVGEQRRAEDCERHMRERFALEAATQEQDDAGDGARTGRLAFGFEIGERGRARRATEYDTPYRVAEFPLIEWEWDRERCRRYIEAHTGVPDWPKSACDFCPFALTSKAGLVATLRRYADHPEALMRTLMIERRSVCLNPRGGLIAGRRLDLLVADRLPHLILPFEERLTWTRHTVFEVRRLWKPHPADPTRVGTVGRSLRIVTTGSRRRCETYLRGLGDVDLHDGIARVYVLRRGEDLPTREHFFVATPAGAQEKERVSFGTWWEEQEHTQLKLLAVAA